MLIVIETVGCPSTGGSQALWRAAVAQDLIQFEIADFDTIYAAYELGVRDSDILATSRPLNFSSHEVAIDRRPREPCFGRG